MSDIPSVAGVRHEFIDVGPLRMHVALAGPEDAPPLLLVHGWPQNWWAWRDVIPELAADFRVIAPDLRGHGWTQAPPGGYEKEQLASDVLGLLDALGVERVSWAGHDWGGWTGFLAALRAPERLERLLALCIPHPWTAPHPRQAALLAYQLPISLPALGARLAGPLSRAILQSGRNGRHLAAGDLDLFARHIPGRVSVAMYRTFLTRELPASIRARPHGPLDVETTLLVGEQDIVTRGSSPGAVSGQPRLTVETVPGVAHWVPEQRPDTIVAWARSALR
jgi:pimeloyl-ACP methyl ester carboxylesterase